MSHILAPKNTTFENLTPLLRRRAGLPDDAELDIYEEIKYEPTVMCQRQRMQDTLTNAQLEHGDILCIQETVQPVRFRQPAGQQAQRPPMQQAVRMMCAEGHSGRCLSRLCAWAIHLLCCLRSRNRRGLP